jgi:two-component system, OmpR family, phosphate regulon sensor histidine kinase PhoR
MKFRTKLFLFYIIAVGLITFFITAYFINFEESTVRRSLHENLLIQAKLIAVSFNDEAQLKNPNQAAEIVAKISKATDARITVVNLDGTVLGDSVEDYRKMANHLDRPEIKDALSGRISSTAHYSKTTKQNLIYLAYPLRINGKLVGAVRVSRSQHELNLLLLRLKGLIIGGIAFTTIFGIILGVFAMGRFTKPIQELQRLVVAISQGNLSQRVKFFGHDDLAGLGRTLNNMAEKLSSSFTTIRDEKRKLEVILENLVDGILVIDPGLRIILANPAARAMLGINNKNIQGRPILEAFLNHHLLELIQEVNRHQAPLESELTLYYPHKQFQVLLAPLKEETGVLVGSIIVLHDLTLLRRLERVRQDFVANVSHELRTPITSIKAMTETLLGGAIGDQEISMRYLRAVDQDCDRLTNLINDLLALAMLDSKVKVTQELFDPVELINEVKERFLTIPGQTPLFEIDLPEDQLPNVYANRDQMRQVLINLLDNAFKYTPPRGKVVVIIRQDGDWLEVAVKDTGIGIPQTDLARIFERFYRVDKGRSREMGGTGLGLSIVKHIVESHGGKVEVESTLNQGSTFSFTIPVGNN